MSGRTVLVTGICGGLGRVVLRRLLAHTEHRVVGLDRRNWVLDTPERFEFRRVDLRRSGAEDMFRTGRPWAVIHLAFVSDQRVGQERRHDVNVFGTQRLLEWCARYGVERVVTLSRASVYGARPDNPSLITEDMPLKLGAAYSELADLVEFDHLCRSWMWRRDDLRICLLRPVHVVGPNIREGMLYRYLSLDPVPTALGFDPMIQLVHEEDVADAIVAALGHDRPGIFNVPGPDNLPLLTLLSLLGRRRLPVPHPILAAADRWAFRTGLSGLPAHAIDFLRFSCLVDGAKIRRELGYAPKHDLRATVGAIPASRGPILA